MLPLPRARGSLRRGPRHRRRPEPGRRPHRRVRPRNSRQGGARRKPPREAEILFPRAAWVAGFEAEADGMLVVDGAGCLRLRTWSGNDTVPLWMRDWRLKTGDGGPRVLDDRGRTVGRVGGKVALGGGEVTKRMVEGGAVVGGRAVARELLERCPGDYFLVNTYSGH